MLQKASSVCRPIGFLEAGQIIRALYRGRKNKGICFGLLKINGYIGHLSNETESGKLDSYLCLSLHTDYKVFEHPL